MSSAPADPPADPAGPAPYGFEFAGARFEIPDPAAVLAGAGDSARPILVGDEPDVTVLISRAPGGGSDGLLPARYRLEGRIRLTAPGFEGSLHPAITGLAYVAPVMDALTRLMGDAGGPDPRRAVPVDVHDPVTGLAGSMTPGRTGWDGKLSHVVQADLDLAEPPEPPDSATSATPADPTDSTDSTESTHPTETGAARLAAFVRMVFDVAREQSDADGDPRYLAGRRYRIALDPPSTRTRPSARPSAWPGRADRPDRVDPEPDDVRLDQLGGLDDVVTQLRDVADSFAHPQVMARWGASRPQGILMWGPPGTGKTTLARALAAEIGGTLKEIRTPDILDQWVGSSERNIKKIFTEARRYRTPTVLLFDEFDSIISYNGAPRGGADQVGNSVAGIFKQEMNTLIEDNPNVIVVATTNFPQRVDESLIRSGRFDVKLSVPLPDEYGRADIWTKLLARLIERHEVDGFRLFGDDLDIPALAQASDGLSGADLKEILRRVQLTKAMQEARGGKPEAISQSDLRTEVTRMKARKPGSAR